MAQKFISPTRAITICKREGLTLPPKGEERLLITGAKLHNDKVFGYTIHGYAHDGSDTARYMGKAYERRESEATATERGTTGS